MKKKKIVTTAALHPRHNLQLFGHLQAYDELMNSFESQKMHHAWLVSGPGGIGKATLIYHVVAKMLGNNARSKMIAGSHPDLLVIEKEAEGKEIAVETVRAVPEFLSLTAAQSQCRIVIIDDAHLLNHNSANALLKILEEPPANAFLFLISSNNGALPATILSRCRKLNLKAPSEVDALSALLAIAPHIDKAEGQALLAIADYSVATALELYNAQGLKAYETILELIGSDALDLKKLYQLDDAMPSWQLLVFLLNFCLFKVIKKASGLAIDAFLSPAEERLVVNMAGQGGLEQLLALWQEVAQLANDTTRSHLDQKQMLLVILNKIRAILR